MKNHNALNDLKIDLASAGICKIDGLRLSNPLCIHATPEQIAYTIALDVAVYATYDKELKDKENQMNEAELEGTEASPIISGGEVLYPNVPPSNIPDDEIPF